MYLAGNLFPSLSTVALEVNHIPEDLKVGVALHGLSAVFSGVFTVAWGSWFEHVRGWCGAEKHCPDALSLFYEDIKRVSRGHVGRDHVRPSLRDPGLLPRCMSCKGTSVTF